MSTEATHLALPASSPETTTGPFTSMAQSAIDLVREVIAPNLPRDLHWDVLIITLVIATLIWLIRRGHGSKGADGQERKTNLAQFLLPRDIYTHQSARVDVYLWVAERLIHPLWAIGLLATVGPATEQAVIFALVTVFGETPALQSNYAWMLLYSLVTFLCYDFVFFATHYMMHRLPALWALHKIHHSAEVLTPLTRYREHFLVGPLWAAGGALSYGFAAGIFAYLFDGGIIKATLFNLSFFALLFGFNGSFRHYHVAFHYPKWLSRWLHSPVMHHVHHSYLPQHWDKNFAAVTSIWDRLFGTLYIPERDEYTPWGLGPESQSDYRTFWQNTAAPFREWYTMLFAKPVPQDSPRPGREKR
jgi:sterol desaturase/sphingolipid hydroxylase (fatty acid hydroxylase superfamily)